MNVRNHQKEVHQEIQRLGEELKTLAMDLWNHPETAWHEEYAAKKLCEFLKSHGLEVEENLYGFPTAFRTEAASGTSPVFAFAAEYDALPLGHACGHNLIAAASVGAMCAASAVLKEKGLQGKFVLLGTPAEESGGGKIRLLEHGILDGVDAVMMTHPGWCTMPDRGSLAIQRYDVIFHGKASHAGGAPELGINALDGVMLLFAGINAYRQQMPDFCRIHGIVTSGGAMPNIIPESAACRFYLRSANEEWMKKLDKRFSEMVQGAALMSGTKVEQKQFSIHCKSRKPNGPLNRSYEEIMTSLGETISPIPKAGRGSSDFGDFSRTKPGVHPYFAISDHKIGGHSQEFMEAARSELGFANMLKAAEAMACIGCHFLSDETFREEVKKDFLTE